MVDRNGLLWRKLWIAEIERQSDINFNLFNSRVGSTLASFCPLRRPWDRACPVADALGNREKAAVSLDTCSLSGSYAAVAVRAVAGLGCSFLPPLPSLAWRCSDSISPCSWVRSSRAAVSTLTHFPALPPMAAPPVQTGRSLSAPPSVFRFPSRR